MLLSRVAESVCRPGRYLDVEELPAGIAELHLCLSETRFAHAQVLSYEPVAGPRTASHLHNR